MQGNKCSVVGITARRFFPFHCTLCRMQGVPGCSGGLGLSMPPYDLHDAKEWRQTGAANGESGFYRLQLLRQIAFASERRLGQRAFQPHGACKRSVWLALDIEQDAGA